MTRIYLLLQHLFSSSLQAPGLALNNPPSCITTLSFASVVAERGVTECLQKTGTEGEKYEAFDRSQALAVDDSLSSTEELFAFPRAQNAQEPVKSEKIKQNRASFTEILRENQGTTSEQSSNRSIQTISRGPVVHFTILCVLFFEAVAEKFSLITASNAAKARTITKITTWLSLGSVGRRASNLCINSLALGISVLLILQVSQLQQFLEVVV